MQSQVRLGYPSISGFDIKPSVAVSMRGRPGTSVFYIPMIPGEEKKKNGLGNTGRWGNRRREKFAEKWQCWLISHANSSPDPRWPLSGKDAEIQRENWISNFIMMKGVLSELTVKPARYCGTFDRLAYSELTSWAYHVTLLSPRLGWRVSTGASGDLNGKHLFEKFSCHSSGLIIPP